MSIQRVQPGVPAGGQFAATVHPESNISLDPSPSPASRVGTVLTARADAERAAELTVCRELAMVVRQRYPDAAYLQMDVSDQGSDAMYPVAILDAGGQEIDDVHGLLEKQAEDLCCELVDDGPWAAHRAYPLGSPARHMTGAPCLDLTSASGITDAQIAGEPAAAALPSAVTAPVSVPAVIPPATTEPVMPTPNWDIGTPWGLRAERNAIAAARHAADHDTADRIEMAKTARGLRRFYPQATHVCLHDWELTTAVSVIRLNDSSRLDIQGVPVGQDKPSNPNSPLQQLAVLARRTDGPLRKLQRFDKPSGHTVVAIDDLEWPTTVPSGRDQG